MDIPKINNIMSTYEASTSASKVDSDDFQKKLKQVMDSEDEKELKKVSQELESIFMNMMLKEMRNTVAKSDLIEAAPGRDIFQSMFDEKISEISSQGEGFGLAKMIYEQVSREMKNRYKVEE